MATRYEIQAQKELVKSALRQLCQEASSLSGKLIPPERQLAEQFDVSRKIIGESLNELIDEGLFYRVSRQGTFFGQPQNQNVEPYLLITPYYHKDDHTTFHLLRFGFEERVAQLGGISLVLTTLEAQELKKHNDLPPLSGVFDATPPPLGSKQQWQGINWVGFGPLLEDTPEADMVRFDDVEGGRQATRHLLAIGHRQIAFLGMPHQDEPQAFFWAAQREQGWRSTMIEAGNSIEDRVFNGRAMNGMHPLNFRDQIAIATEAASGILQQGDIEAVVATNSFATQGLFNAFRNAERPAASWPAVICFDDDPLVPGALISSLRLPWEAVGRTAAELLWQRKVGRLTGLGQERLISMRLIPRMSCRSRWVISSGLAKRYIDDEQTVSRDLNSFSHLNYFAPSEQILNVPASMEVGTT